MDAKRVHELDPAGLEELAAGAEEAAVAAGELLETYRGDLASLTLEDKSGGHGVLDLVTDADRASDALLAERLRAVAHLPYWSEERGERPADPLYWLVDPLDGTNNFVNGIPLYGITVALVREATPLVGVSHFPALGTTAVAVAGRGARLDGQPVAPLTARPHASWLVEVNTQPSDVEQVRNLAALVGEVRAVRIFGSIALSLTWVGTGGLDLFLGRGHPWDVAAGMLFVIESGGACIDLETGATGTIFERRAQLYGHPRVVAQVRRRLRGDTSGRDTR